MRKNTLIKMLNKSIWLWVVFILFIIVFIILLIVILNNNEQSNNIQQPLIITTDTNDLSLIQGDWKDSEDHIFNIKNNNATIGAFIYRITLESNGLYKFQSILASSFRYYVKLVNGKLEFYNKLPTGEIPVFYWVRTDDPDPDPDPEPNPEPNPEPGPNPEPKPDPGPQPNPDPGVFPELKGDWEAGNNQYIVTGNQIFKDDVLVFLISSFNTLYRFTNQSNSEYIYYVNLKSGYLELYEQPPAENDIPHIYWVRPDNIKSAPRLGNGSTWLNPHDKDFLNIGIVKDDNKWLTLLPDENSTDRHLLWTIEPGKGPFFTLKTVDESSTLSSYNMVYDPNNKIMSMYHVNNNENASMTMIEIENPLKKIEGEWDGDDGTSYNIEDTSIKNTKTNSISYSVYQILAGPYVPPPSPGNIVLKPGYIMYIWHDASDKTKHEDDKTAYYGLNETDDEILYRFLWEKGSKSKAEIFTRP